MTLRVSTDSVQRLIVAAPTKPPVSTTVKKTKENNLSAPLSQIPKIRFNGFLSAGASRTNAAGGANYNIPGHGAVSNKIGFASSSLVGLQATAKLTPWADVVSQFVASGDGTNGQMPYSLNAGWAFLRLKLSPEVQLHVGRFRLPIFLYSATQQVGYSYPWQYLPGEVYRIVPFDNMNGLSFVLSKTLADTGWSVSFQPFFGENKSQYNIDSSKLVDFNEDDIVGARLSIGNNNFTLRGAYAHLALSSPGKGGGLPPVSVKDADFWSVGGKLNMSKLFIAGEFSQRQLSDQLAALRGYYATVGLRLDKWMPALTYANLNTTNSPKLEKPEKQTSYTASLDYYINASLVVKSSVSYVMPDGTFGLFDQDPQKKAVFVYGAELDAIF